jgi:hypothetical protein
MVLTLQRVFVLSFDESMQWASPLTADEVCCRREVKERMKKVWMRHSLHHSQQCDK